VLAAIHVDLCPGDIIRLIRAKKIFVFRSSAISSDLFDCTMQEIHQRMLQQKLQGNLSAAALNR